MMQKHFIDDQEIPTSGLLKGVRRSMQERLMTKTNLHSGTLERSQAEIKNPAEAG